MDSNDFFCPKSPKMVQKKHPMSAARSSKIGGYKGRAAEGGQNNKAYRHGMPGQ